MKFCGQAQFQFSTSQVELSLALNLVITDHPHPVPVALEEIIDGLDTETNEEDDNLELAKEGGVHEN